MTRKAVPKSIADRVTKKVLIRLDGEDWPIVITHNVLIECEELTGLNVLTGEANIVKPSFTLLRALLYIALKRAGAKYTLEQIGDLLGPHNIATVQTGLLEAWAGSMPSPEEVEEEERPITAVS